MKLKKHFHEIIKTKTSPNSIASGFAIGTFLGIMPMFGIDIVIAVLAVLMFRSISKYALIGAMALWNPLVLVPIYYLSKKIGNLLLGSTPVVEYQVTLLDQAFDFTRRFLLGNLIIAIAISIASYFIIKAAVNKHQRSL